MKQIKLKQIGSFTKTHGVHGQLALNLSDNVSFDLLDKGLIEKEAVFVELDGIPVPFFIAENGIRELNDTTILISLEDIDDEKAKQLYPCKVYLNTYYLSDFDETDQDDPNSWIGFLVNDTNLGEIGKIKEFIDLKENPLLNIDFKGQDLLIPLLADFLLEVDIEKETLIIELPDGYLEALS
jgi:16S rRNA processing protein RimM